tara:strand:+ start:219 stop:740 length:522 start_codon:yes stop_codon:yes gene_type:complete
MNFSRIEFWNYSLRFYDDPETEEAFIDAQNRLGADVNLILYLLFRAQGGHRLDFDDIKTAENSVNSWRSGVIQPLREIRRNLKNSPHSLSEKDQAKIRCEIKNLEIKTEKFQQQHLENLNLKGRPAAPHNAAQDNLAAYAQILSAAASDHAFIKLLRRFITLQNAKPSPANSN